MLRYLSDSFVPASLTRDGDADGGGCDALCVQPSPQCLLHLSFFFFFLLIFGKGYSLVTKVSKIICEFNVAEKFKGKPDA